MSQQLVHLSNQHNAGLQSPAQNTGATCILGCRVFRVLKRSYIITYNSISGYTAKRTGSRYLRGACTPTLTGASFLTHHRGKHPKYPSTDEWIETGGYIIHTIEYDSARKDRNSDTHHNMEEK